MLRKRKIHTKLKQLGISNSQLAQHAMLSTNALILWMNGKIVIPYEKILRIVQLLDLELDDFLEIA